MLDERPEIKLPLRDQRQIMDMALRANSSPDAIMQEMIRAYLGMVRDVPAAVPSSPLRSLAMMAAGKGGRQ